MKKIVFTVCLAFAVLTSQAQKFKVKAHVVGLKNDSLLVLKWSGKQASAEKVGVHDGNFEFEGAISEPYFLQLFKIRNGSRETEGKLTEFLAESGNISIYGKSPEFSRIEIKGSSSDKVLKAYLKEDQKMAEQWNLLKVEYDKYVLQKDTLRRKAAGEELNRILFKQRVPLLKQYVAKYNNTILGALLPNFCTLQEVLRKEDYLAMYQLLSPAMQMTNYGKSIYEKAK